MSPEFLISEGLASEGVSRECDSNIDAKTPRGIDVVILLHKLLDRDHL